MMPSGRYYIGDLCYVMRGDEWNDVCDVFLASTAVEGEHVLASGKRFAEYRTAYGDGRYPCSNGSELPVDSGGIGCILVDDVDQSAEGCDLDGGTIVEFERPFDTYSNGDGLLTFGHITVDTSDSTEDDNEYWDDGEDDEPEDDGDEESAS